MSEDESNIPDRDTCQKLTEEFAAITSTNEALAQTFLQDHEWKLEPSISAFYEVLEKENKSLEKAEKASQPPDLKDPEIVQKLFGEGKSVTSVPPSKLKFITWNLDGLDEKNLKKRTRAVIKYVQKHEPDIIFFQEVIDESGNYIQDKLPEYHCIKSGHEGYFTMTLLRIFTIFYDKHVVYEYPQSLMGRNLLVVEAHMAKLKFQLLNTHLESTAEHTLERMNQLKFAFNKGLTFDSSYTIIFGGDLNLRDKELEGIGGIPRGFFDMWVHCGSHKDFRYTWDMTRNTNKEFPGRFKPRCRFDRVYVKDNQKRVTPKIFSLFGIEKVPQTQSFPSDHWGIVVIFDLDHS